jgi:uncharacterized protein with beta-barrel porin domain
MKVKKNVSLNQRVRVRALQTSAMLGALLVAGPVYAQCAPDPTVAKGTTTCTGTDADGLIVSTVDTKVVVAGNATVRAGKAAAAILSRSPSPSFEISGLVDGGANGAGLFVTTDPATQGNSADVAVTVLAGGKVTGAQGIVFKRDTSSGSAKGYISAVVDNAGTITAATGPAIVADLNATDDDLGRNGLSVLNRTGGMIRGISGLVRQVVNAGLIDGGGSTAINATGTLTLINAGTINGSVLVGDAHAGGEDGSIIDTRDGTINGDVKLGNGINTVLARYDAKADRITSVTGTLDGGRGYNGIFIPVDTDTTVRNGALATNFRLLGLDIGQNAVATIAPGLTSGTSLAIGGTGTLINQAKLVTTTFAVRDWSSANGPNFINQGSVETTIDVTADSPPRFAVWATGNVTNSGTITARGTNAVRAASSLTNSGTIQSFTGAGAVVNSVKGASSNSGTIDGATFGLVLNAGRFVNNGTIHGGEIGAALDSTTLINAAGGVIRGDADADGKVGTGVWGQSAVIANAGRITGSVDFYDDRNTNVFVDDGGTVSGAIWLGSGDDQLVVDLAADPTRPLAGAAGGVDAGSGWDTLRYRVKADANASLALRNGFEALAYELTNGAKLTLTAPSPLTTTIGLVGNGAVTLNGSVSITDRTLVDASIKTTDQLTGAGAGPDRKLTITNNGTLALTTTGPSDDDKVHAAIEADVATIVNNGTITATNAANRLYPSGAIFGGRTVTNAGTISLSGGGTAIRNARDVVNTGTITDTAGSKALAIVDAGTLTNSGTIRVDGIAVQAGRRSAFTLINSGTIESRQATAVTVMSAGSTLTNEATGTIRATNGNAISLTNGGFIINRGAITGNIATSGRWSPYSTAYVADGGTLTGNLTFGAADDLFLQTGATTGVTGTIDGGAGDNIFGYSRKASDAIAIDTPGAINFDRTYAEALGADTRVTLTATKHVAGPLYLAGDGTIINEAAIDGAAQIGLPSAFGILGRSDRLAALINHGTILGGVDGMIQAFSNTGTIGSATLQSDGVSQQADKGTLTFDNSGTIDGGAYTGATLGGTSLAGLSAINSGTINGGLDVWATFAQQDTPANVAVTNNGIITSAQLDPAVSIDFGSSGGSTNGAATVTFTNGGTITSSNPAGTGAYLSLSITGSSYAITNSGTIQATGNGSNGTGGDVNSRNYRFANPAAGLVIEAGPAVTGSIANSGTIQATGTTAVALMSTGALDLTNSGTIRGGTGTVLTADDPLTALIGKPFLAGAIQTTGTTADRIVNTGTIIGSIGLGDGSDRIENRGRIDGNVFLGAGDDTFLQGVNAVLNGTVDGGEGTDSLIVEANTDGAINGDQFVNFERFTQTGSGKVAYSGNFKFTTIDLAGANVSVAAGQTLASTGPVTIKGSDGAETITNAGTIAGTVDLGAGDDRVVNTGTINGAVLLGAGNDSFVEGPGSRVAGGVDGGEGDDLYTVQLAGDADHIGQRSNFERLGVEGSGTLTLKLDQNFQSVALTGAGLNVALNGFTIGRVTGSDAAETLTSDGDIAAVSLGGGNDELALGTARASGVYDGGAGTDLLHFTGSGPVTLAGTATGFERVALDGKALTIIGTLGTRDAALAFGDGGNAVTLAKGGTLAGTIDLGAGNDSFRLVAGSTLRGTVSGGAGTDTATIEIADNQTLDGNTLRNFEILASEGKGTLTLTGAQRYDRVVANTDLAVAANGSLTTQTVTLGAGGRRLAIAGGFNGAVQGGAGTDTVQVSGGSEAAPVVFSRVASVEAFGMTGGFARIYGDAALGAVTLSGGRLVGQGGSTISASQITVGPNATFGSAGIVTGNVTIAGTLSPGASPGTMTVNGNVALAAGSVSLFELTPTVSDKLIVNGNVAIAPGATLRIVPQGTLRPGTSYDLITASGGITGSYTTVDKPNSVFGFLIQRADRIQLLGQFLDNPAAGAQASRSIAYLNAALQVQPSTSTLFDAVPALLTASGASNAPAFARLTPEPYAAATQLGIDQALSLGDVARGPGFATTRREEVGAFTFAQGIGQWHTLGGDRAAGTAEARSSGYGFLGGIGVGDRDWSVGVFAGYLDSRQRLAALDARTRTDGFVAGLHARYAEGPIRLSASLLYDGGDAHTARALPNALTATSDYRLHNWVSDLSAGYAVAVGGEWAVTPRIGITAIRTTRDRVVEQGGAFALTVAQNRHAATFADAGAGFARADTSDAAFRPYVGFGLRAQLQGRKPEAFGGYAGAPLVLGAFGAQRAPLVGTVSAGVGYRLNDGIELFSTVEAQTGRDDHRESIATGVRLRF